MALTQVKTSGLADDAVTGAKIADDTVAEANMANDAISLAELKAGTDGQIITYDASGNPTAVGPGTDGQVLTSTGAGSPPAFETLPTSGATLSGSTNNTVVTVTGSNAMQGEANLTFDGNNLTQTIDAHSEGFYQTASGAHLIKNVVDSNRTSAADSIYELIGRWNGKNVAGVQFSTGSDTTNKDDGYMVFKTSSADNLSERLRIDKDGNVGIGTSPSYLTHIKKDTGSGAVGTKVVIENAATDSANNNVEFYLKTDAGDFGFKHYNATESYVQVPDALIINTNTASSATQAVHIDTSQNVKVSNGNLVIGTAGKGIDFSAQTATSAGGATTNSELFDHYEEGSFTPFIQGSGSNNSKTYTSQYGQYTRIGNMVHCVFEIRVNNIYNVDSGGVLINGFPFGHRGSAAGAYGTVAMNNCNHEDEADISFEPVSGAAYFYLLESKNSHSLSNLGFSDFPQNDTFQIRASMSYPVS